MHKKLLFILSSLLGLASCSIMEDRWPCPCYLVFDPQQDVLLDCPGGFQLTVYHQSSAEKELTTDITWESIRNDSYEVRVSKGEKQMSILEGLREQYISGTDILIIPGNQADSIYACSVPVNCSGEQASVPVFRHKQFATVFLKMENGDGATYPFRLRIRGNIDGVNLLSLEPHSGDFSHTCENFGAQNEFRFRIPRQRDDTLVMELWDKDRPDSTEPADVLHLGELIRESGYRWDTESLDDIYIGVDYAQAGIRISINDWETVLELNEQI